MCGIAGIVRYDDARPERARLARMADSLRHRGPDDEGIEIAGRAGLAHRRLSIIDLAHGHPPLVAADAWVGLAYNG